MTSQRQARKDISGLPKIYFWRSAFRDIVLHMYGVVGTSSSSNNKAKSVIQYLQKYKNYARNTD